MIRKILCIMFLFIISNCTIVGFDKGLNYMKDLEYIFDYDKGSQLTSIQSKKSRVNIGIMFRRNSCGYYALTGPLIFPIIPFWENYDCKDIVIGVSQVKKIHIIYNDKIYQPYKVVRGGGYFFPLPIKSITDTAILVVEKNDGEIFEIPIRYKHSFSFDLWPGR